MPAYDERLPNFCAARLPTTNEAVLIKRGESGYFPLDGGDPDAFNSARGVTAEMVECMQIGSMFGWHMLSGN